MTGTFLDRVLAKTRARVEMLKRDETRAAVELRARVVRNTAVPHRFRTSLQRTDRTNIIAEIKRASPSKGIINAEIEINDIARDYHAGGAAAISVLTEAEFFGGSLEDLILVSRTAGIPVLRKDFIVDEYQIYEAAASGADAILLIVAALSESELEYFVRLSESELGIDALVEVHGSDELERAKGVGANIIGVNNRDLKSLEVSLDVSRRLIGSRCPETLMIAESGISTREEIDELKALGFDGFLIGETLMRSGDVVQELRNFTTRHVDLRKPAL